MNQQEIFTVGGNAYGDPCGLRSTAPFGAGGTGPDPVLNPGEPQPTLASGQTAAGAASAKLICQAMMGATGANRFYNVSDAPAGGGALFNWINQIGNPNLLPETADTWTYGFVINPPFKSPLLSGINITLDAYKIKIDNAILQTSVDNANFNCYGAMIVTTAAEAAGQAASAACQLNPRDQASGVPLSTTISYSNQATIDTAGFDMALNWRASFADFGSKMKGGLSYSLQSTFLDYYKTKQSPAIFDVADGLERLARPEPHRHPGRRVRLPLVPDVELLPRHLEREPALEGPALGVERRLHEPTGDQGEQRGRGGGRHEQDRAGLRADDGNQDGLVSSVRPRVQLQLPSEDVAARRYHERLEQAPVDVASTAGFPIGTNLPAICNGAPGCQNPTSPSLQTTGAFNGGYYDVQGRRAFLGFNVNF